MRRGLTSFLHVYGYGGAVVPRYCTDPPATIAMNKPDAIITWLGTVAGLKVEVVRRTVGTYSAWQLDLTVSGAPGCAAGKGGLAALWTIDGQQITLPETISDPGQLRAYLIQVPGRIVIMTATDSTPGEYPRFLREADVLFSSVQFP